MTKVTVTLTEDHINHLIDLLKDSESEREEIARGTDISPHNAFERRLLIILAKAKTSAT